MAARELARRIEIAHDRCLDAAQGLEAEVGQLSQARSWQKKGSLPGGLQPPESHLPAIHSKAGPLAAVLTDLLREFPEVRAWWDGIDREELFELLDPEAWPHAPLCQVRVCVDDVRDYRRACFEVALGVVNDLVGADRSPGLLDAVLHDDGIEDWMKYLCPIVNLLSQGAPGSTRGATTGADVESGVEPTIATSLAAVPAGRGTETDSTATAPTPTVADPPGAKKGRRRYLPGEINTLVSEDLQRRGKHAVAVTIQAIADATGVSAGSVHKTAAWQAFEAKRKQLRGSRSKRSVSFSDQMLAAVPDRRVVGPAELSAAREIADQNSTVLADLIEDQRRDQAADERPRKRRRS